MQRIFKYALLSLSLIVCLTYAEEYKILRQIVYYPTYKINAKVLGLKQSIISPQITGHIQKVYVEAGSQVKAKQTLAKLDCFNHERQLQLAKIGTKKTQKTISLLKKQLNREEQLHKTKNISQAQFEVTANNLALAKLALSEQQVKIKQLKYTIGLCEVKAPFAGVITQKLTEIGQASGPGAIIFEILNLQSKVLLVMLPQNLIPSLMRSTNYRFKSQQKSYPVIHKVSIPKIQTNRSQEIHFDMPNNPNIIIGMSGQILWQDSKPHIPSKYLKRYNNQLGIYLLSNNQLIFKRIPTALEGQAVATALPLNTKLVITHPNSNSIKVID